MLKDLFSAVIVFVKAAEQAYPEGGKGKEKLEAVSAQILAFAPLVGLAIETATAMLPMFQGFASTVVGYFNATNLFKTTTSTK